MKKTDLTPGAVVAYRPYKSMLAHPATVVAVEPSYKFVTTGYGSTAETKRVDRRGIPQDSSVGMTHIVDENGTDRIVRNATLVGPWADVEREQTEQREREQRLAKMRAEETERLRDASARLNDALETVGLDRKARVGDSYGSSSVVVRLSSADVERLVALLEESAR